MQVVAEEAWDWFLFDDAGNLYLDVLVEHGAISYTVTAELNADQRNDYARNGMACVSALAAQMRYQAMMRQWSAPKLPSEWSQRSTAAVHAWQKRRSERSNGGDE